MRHLGIILLLLLACKMLFISSGHAQKKPETFLLRGELLLQDKAKISNGSEQHSAALRELLSKADRVLSKEPYSIVNKPVTPPGGTKHDYYSLAPYWWPDPSKKNGIPYIQKDGITNPESNAINDKRLVASISKDIQLLGLAYFFTNEEKYAEKASLFLRVFFLNNDTRMNPNLRYGQGIRGIHDGRGVGLIETEHLVYLIDGVQLLEGSTSWTLTDQKALQNWFRQFQEWMLKSSIGKDAGKSDNNIGTYYDLQIVIYAMYYGNAALAKSHLENYTLKRINKQFEIDGSQPLELKRTNSWTYCIKNIKGWMNLACLGDRVGVDIWNYETREGKSLKCGIQWLLPFASGHKIWEHKETHPLNLDWYIPIARKSVSIYKDLNLKMYLVHLPVSTNANQSKSLLMHYVQ